MSTVLTFLLLLLFVFILLLLFFIRTEGPIGEAVHPDHLLQDAE